MKSVRAKLRGQITEVTSFAATADRKAACRVKVFDGVDVCELYADPAMLDGLQVGSQIECLAEFKSHPTYGLQVRPVSLSGVNK